MQIMHRVFQADASDYPAGGGIAGLRAFFCSLGLSETEALGSYMYWHGHADGERQFATVHGGRRTVTIYLYPDALGRGAGHASTFYRTLDDAGLGMGSKAGPSISLDLEDAAQVRLFREGLEELFR
jgi:hypothetical protein